MSKNTRYKRKSKKVYASWIDIPIMSLDGLEIRYHRIYFIV